MSMLPSKYNLILDCPFPMIQSFVEQSRDMYRPVEDVFEDYRAFLQSLSRDQNHQSKDPLVMLMFYLHLMHPIKFRTDCNRFFNQYLKNMTQQSDFAIYFTEIAGKKMALSVDIAKHLLYITEIKGLLQPHQKWALMITFLCGMIQHLKELM